MTFMVYMFTLPFAWIHRGRRPVRTPDGGTRPTVGRPMRPAKPSWAFSREV